MKKIILDLCGGTGSWSKPYADAGYDVRLVTLPEQDVRLYIPPDNVYGILAAPPCTHLASSGARWFKEKGESALLDALSSVDACIRIIHVSQPVFWCLENPVGRLVRWMGKPKMYFHPYEYGDPYTKKTCLWGIFNTPRKSPVEPEKKNKIHHMPPSKDRAMLRSITPSGFAKAFYEVNF